MRTTQLVFASLSVSCLCTLASGLSTANYPSTSTATTEAQLVRTAVPLPAATNKAQAIDHLLTNGVCRLNKVVNKEHCENLRDYVLKHLPFPNNHDTLSANTNPHNHDAITNVPGIIRDTRLNCGSEPILIPLNQRTDMLVPLQHPLIRETLQVLLQQLSPIYESGVPELLPPRNASPNHNNNNGTIQLLEAASLISLPGATHQTLHADFRRDAAHPSQRLPPRLVTFLYLQDTPTTHHGPTIFLPRTNHHRAHQEHYHQKHAVPQRCSGSSSNDNDNAVAATLEQGDVAIYDASVLHFGSANAVQGNTRAVFYFGVGHVSTTSVEDDGEFLAPVTMDRDEATQEAFWSHDILF